MLLRTVMVAHATLDAIDAAIDADDGARFRVLQGEVLASLDDWRRGVEDGRRGHLGASVLGRDCARSIWYGFRWAHKVKFIPRMLRLFNRGHIEEGRFIAMLKMIGCEFWYQDDQGRQFRIEFADGHGGGSGDGVGRGCPDLPAQTVFVTEFKTHGEKSFIKLAGKLDEWRNCRKRIGPSRGQFTGEGVRLAKFEHFVQMQLYMHKMGIAAALYMAVCKNTDDLYAEVVHLDTAFAEQYINRGEQLTKLTEPPKRISESPGFWKCRGCDDAGVCHRGEAPQLSCRTCLQVEVGPAGTWRCVLHGAILDRDRQRVGCTDYTADHRF